MHKNPSMTTTKHRDQPELDCYRAQCPPPDHHEQREMMRRTCQELNLGEIDLVMANCLCCPATLAVTGDERPKGAKG